MGGYLAESKETIYHKNTKKEEAKKASSLRFKRNESGDTSVGAPGSNLKARNKNKRDWAASANMKIRLKKLQILSRLKIND